MSNYYTYNDYGNNSSTYFVKKISLSSWTNYHINYNDWPIYRNEPWKEELKQEEHITNQKSKFILDETY